jgi:hypothetical protein
MLSNLVVGAHSVLAGLLIPAAEVHATAEMHKAAFVVAENDCLRI